MNMDIEVGEGSSYTDHLPKTICVRREDFFLNLKKEDSCIFCEIATGRAKPSGSMRTTSPLPSWT